MLSVFDTEGINVSNISSLSTDGAPVMMSEKVGVVTQFKKHGFQIKKITALIINLILFQRKLAFWPLGLKGLSTN